eukprot:GFYU01001439.1.p1 GENE.GFYU01001439.1~~GFYU01001439.1.p1  ORF type:complete len:689 (-),score=195.42 GFYU01001439.1:63-2075(-)
MSLSKPGSTNKRGLWEGVDSRLFTEGPVARQAQLSHDGRTLAYIDSGALLLMPLDDNGCPNGPVTHLTSVELTGALSTGTEYGGLSFCWSQDCESIFFSCDGKMHRVSAHGGMPIPIHGFGKSYAPHAGPNGSMACCVEEDDTMSAAFYRGKPLQRTLSVASTTSDQDVEGELWQKQWPTRLPTKDVFIYDPQIHPTEPLVAYHSWSPPFMAWNSSHIHVFNQQNNMDWIVSPSDGEFDVACYQPQWNPSGTRLAFLCDKSGWVNLWTVEKDGNNCVNVMEKNEDVLFRSFWTTGMKPYAWLDDDTIVTSVRSPLGGSRFATISVPHKRVVYHPEVNRLQGSYFFFFSPALPKETENGVDLTFTVCCSAHDNVGSVELIRMNRHGDAVNLVSANKLIQNGLLLSPAVRDNFVPARDVSYVSSYDKGVVHAVLYCKGPVESDDKAPALIFVHGGPTGGVFSEFHPYTQYFASRGWAVLVVNYRGSVGHGRQYREALNGYWGVYDVHDVADGAKYLVEEGIAHEKKVVVTGGSAGGYTTLLSLIQYSDVFAAGISMCGVADVLALKNGTHLLERHYDTTLVGSYPEHADLYRERSPITYADRITKPLLLLQGTADTVVPREHSVMIKEAAKGHVEYVEYEGEGHVLFTKRHIIRDICQKTFAFATAQVNKAL